MKPLCFRTFVGLFTYQKFMKDALLSSVSVHFESLIPQNQESILLLVALYRKIQNNEIDDAFTQKDFEEAVQEVGDALDRGKQILLHHH